MSTIGDDLLRSASAEFGPAIKALVVYNSNPVAVAPDSGKVVEGFAREDLFTVVLEHFKTDTADYADYILPATTQLEHWDIHTTYGHTDVLLNRPAIAPVGQSRTNTDIFRGLAREMGLTDACFEESDESMCRKAMGAAIDFDTLLGQGFCSLPLPDAPFANGSFATASGKCEFLSAYLERETGDGLPQHLPNYEVAKPLDSFPLAMISPPARNFLNSTFVNLKSLRDMEGEPLLEISEQDAQERGISSGDLVRVFNHRGQYHCVARVTDRARAGVVHGLGIWWRKLGAGGTNVNELTSQRLTDMGRAPTFYDCAVQVEAG
jgi:anaerobic selenocysteine-containing dehydrogenase